MLLAQADGTERFGPRLRSLRERAGLTQEELAERAGLTPHAVSALERGIRTRPYPNTVRLLASALELSSEDRADLVASIPARGTPRSGTTPGVNARADAPDTGVAGDLGIPATPLFGREDDIVAVLGLVSSGARLVTLTGPGGVGKTRLLAAVTERVGHAYPDGVVLVPLAGLLEPSGLVPTIGRALGLSSGDGPQTMALVIDHLQHRDLLLVLDNFEHLLTGAVDVGRLVSACPRLTVLVSSRAPLRVRGEQEYDVAPLRLPTAGATTREDLLESPSGALLLNRARAAASTLATTPAEVAALAELCWRMAGLPLAIELVSARLRLLDPQTLLERLDDLTAAGGPRDLPARQRTMRATLDWSYGLLSTAEQALFRILGTFRAGATLEAVETVSRDACQVPPADTLGLLETLVEHSLVVIRSDQGGRQRFDMLEPIAQYARALLIADEAARATRSHAGYYAELAEQAAEGYERADQVTWLAWTEAEEANLLVALDRSLGTADEATAARIAWSMWLYWWMRGQVTLGRRKAEACLTVDLPDPLRGRVHLAAATMSFAGGELTAAADHWSEALRLAEGDPELGSKAVAGIGLAALARGDLGTAANLFDEALPLTAAAGPAGRWLSSLVHVWRGTTQLLRGDLDSAVEDIRLGLDSARDRGDRLSTYVALFNLSQVAIAAGDGGSARGHLEEGIRLSGETQDMANLAYFLDALAVVEADEQHWPRVPVLLAAAQSLRESVGADVYGYYKPDDARGKEAARAARDALGPDIYDDAADQGRDLEPPELVHYALTPD